MPSCIATRWIVLTVLLMLPLPQAMGQGGKRAQPQGGKASVAEIDALLREATQLHAAVLKLYGQRKCAEAEPLARQALDIRRKHFPEGHPAVAQSQNALAII